MPLWMLRELVALFSNVIAVDPVSALLFVVGNLLIAFSVVVFGGLTLGAALNLVRPT